MTSPHSKVLPPQFCPTPQRGWERMCLPYMVHTCPNCPKHPGETSKDWDWVLQNSWNSTSECQWTRMLPSSWAGLSTSGQSFIQPCQKAKGRGKQNDEPWLYRKWAMGEALQ